MKTSSWLRIAIFNRSFDTILFTFHLTLHQIIYVLIRWLLGTTSVPLAVASLLIMTLLEIFWLIGCSPVTVLSLPYLHWAQSLPLTIHLFVVWYDFNLLLRNNFEAVLWEINWIRLAYYLLFKRCARSFLLHHLFLMILLSLAWLLQVHMWLFRWDIQCILTVLNNFLVLHFVILVTNHWDIGTAQFLLNCLLHLVVTIP